MKLYYTLVILLKLAAAAVRRDRPGSTYLHYLMKQVLLNSI